jgi:hypothetical protein
MVLLWQQLPVQSLALPQYVYSNCRVPVTVGETIGRANHPSPAKVMSYGNIIIGCDAIQQCCLKKVKRTRYLAASGRQLTAYGR